MNIAFHSLMLVRCLNQGEDECFYVDVHDYGVFLLELISGKSACQFEEQGEGHNLIDWVRYLVLTYYLIVISPTKKKNSSSH